MILSAKGQITIPLEVRKQVGLHPGDKLTASVVDGKVVIAPVPGQMTRGERLVARARGCMKGKLLFTGDELMALTRGEV